MNPHIQRSFLEDPRPTLSWSETWEAEDNGLIKCWEVGRELAIKRPELAHACLAGELPPLGWKGGVARSLKKHEKFGSLNYLAQWQGLRGENLDVDTSTETVITCSRTHMIVTFTPEKTKYLNQAGDTQEQGATAHE